MKITINLKEGYTLKEYQDALNAVERELFGKFKQYSHTDECAGTCFLSSTENSYVAKITFGSYTFELSQKYKGDMDAYLKDKKV